LSSWDRVVAAIDFGTFSSGFAWAKVGPETRRLRNDDINLYHVWPSSGGWYPKTRSALLFDPDGSLVAWGYDAVRRFTESPDTLSSSFVQDFKMLLWRGSYPGVRPPENKTGKTPEDLIAVYLGELYKKAVSRLESADVSDDQVDWWVTVPGIWPESGKQTMLRAADTAGMPVDRLNVALEPEAAALYCMAVGESQPVGTRILVVDCGGGTVDLVSLEVRPDGDFGRKLTHGIPMGAESTIPELEKKIAEMLGGTDYWYLKKTKPRSVQKFWRDWEDARNSFTADQEHPVRITFPSLPQDDERYARMATRLLGRREQEGEIESIVISASDVRGILDRLVRPICDCVDGMLRELAVDGRTHAGQTIVYAVGGFAESHYLQHHLREVVEGRGARLTVPERTSSAVLAGAVIYGARPSLIKTRTSSLTYGYGIRTDFNSDEDPPDRCLIDEEGNPKVRRLKILVERGKTIKYDEEVCSTAFPVEKGQQRATFVFYATESIDPRYPDEEGVQKKGTITVELPKLPRRRKRKLHDRPIRLFATFGDTKIDVRAIDEVSGEAAIATIEFSP
jgi:hypothetical protein